MVYFESQRLVFRDWEEKDLDEFIAMNKDSKVMEFFPNVLSETQTELLFKTIQEEFKQFGYGLYAVETKDYSEFIGFIGFHWATFESNFTPCIEIGWRLKKEVWGNGYATEGAKACLEYGFSHLKFKEIYSFTAKLNKRSENVMRKIGMRKLTEFNHPKVDSCSKLLRHVLYRIISLESIDKQTI